MGRNDPCPCGSGKKYKRCCGAAAAGTPKLSLMSHDDAGGATRDRCWEADVVPIALTLEDDAAARTAAVLVVCDGLVLHSEVQGRAPAEPDQVAQVLNAALSQAAADRGGLPAAVWVRHDEVRDALARLPDLGSVRIAAVHSLPTLDPAALSLIQHLTGAERAHRIGGPETWRGWGFSNAVIAKLLEAAAEFYRAAPWRALTNAQLLYAAMPDGREWAACTLGNAGNEFGLALYADREDFFRQVEAPTHSEGIDSLRGELVSLVFCSRNEIPRRMLKEISAKGWEVAGPDAYPAIIPINTPGGGLTRRHVQDMDTLLRLIPRFVERYRGILMSRLPPASPMEWCDENSGTVLRYEGSALGSEMPLWRPPLELGLALPTGPAADPEAALEPLDAVEATKERQRIVDRFRTALEADGLSAATVKRHTGNVADFLLCLCDFHAVSLNALTEYDLRSILYDWYIRKLRVPVTHARAMLASLKRFVAFAKESEGLEFAWAAAVLKESDEFEERWVTFPGGFWWDPEVQDWQVELSNDLDARVLIPDSDMAGGERWGATMGTVEWTLSHELQRRWLLWRDEVVKSGVVEPADVRAALVLRQRKWETTPHAAHGGATPVEAILREREATGS
jgi:hypothetical protein